MNGNTHIFIYIYIYKIKHYFNILLSFVISILILYKVDSYLVYNHGKIRNIGIYVNA